SSGMGLIRTPSAPRPRASISSTMAAASAPASPTMSSTRNSRPASPSCSRVPVTMATTANRIAIRRPAPARAEDSRAVSRRTALLHRAGGQSGDVVVEEEHVDHDDGDGAQDGAGHQRAPEVDVAADQLADDAHGHRLLVRRRGERERVDELVPGEREGEE